jgi:hypothetical protein
MLLGGAARSGAVPLFSISAPGLTLSLPSRSDDGKGFGVITRAILHPRVRRRPLQQEEAADQRRADDLDSKANSLILLVGAQGLEPWTR